MQHHLASGRRETNQARPGQEQRESSPADRRHHPGRITGPVRGGGPEFAPGLCVKGDDAGVGATDVGDDAPIFNDG